MTELLAGKVVAILGGATGIGGATSRAAAEAGARVVLGYVNEAAAAHVVADIGLAGRDAVAVRTDVRDEESVARFVALAIARFGRLDGVFLNQADTSRATLSRDTDAVDVPLEVWETTLEVTLRGHLIGIRHALPALLRGGGGSIVCASSVAVFRPSAVNVAYSVAKAGISGLVRHVSERWGADGIRANAVAPGPTMTEEGAPFRTDEHIAVRLANARSPRLGVPADIANAVCFLLSDDAAGVNGEVLSVDGGTALRA
jgi:NAD(P)-dependent dehydrogenase (short-subunit alcohol dehydrogenase family)